MRKNVLRFIGVFALVGSGCLPTYEAAAPNVPQGPTEGPSGPQTAATTSSEPAAVRPLSPEEQSVAWLSADDVAALAARANEEGPIELASRRHACMKMKYATLGSLLNSLGVNMGTLPVTAATNCNTLIPAGRVATRDLMPASYVYCSSRLTLGYPQYEARLAEITSATTASSTKLLDLLITAAPEIIANAPTRPQCMVNGQPSQIFNADNTCNAAGISCIQGYQATDDQVALCNRVVTQAVATPAMGTAPAVSAVDNGKRIAVAAILSAAHSCE